MPQAARTFRIFVSSTFNDLKAERNALQERVYPRLKELCERHGTRFQAIDLRWGVSEEAAKDQQTINICLTEVDRCQHTSPRPNFVVLLGDRYGWRPPPPQIEAEEFEAIRGRVSAAQKELLDECYRRDDNAVPPEYCLREREDGFYEDFDAWDAIERKLTLALRSGAAAAGLGADKMTKYVASATEQEIERGALSVEDAPDHVFCFFRKITNHKRLIADIPGTKVERPDAETPLAEDFVDLIDPENNRSLDAEARDRLEALKDRLRAFPGNVEDYEAQWTGSNITTNHIAKLCDDVWERLSSVIRAELKQLGEVDELQREIDAHKSFGDERARFFVPRFFTTGENALERIAAHVTGADAHPLAVAGVSGSGKSALIAKAAQHTNERHSDAVLIRRFIGATPESTDGRALLGGLCREIARAYGDDEAVPADYRELVEEFPKRLKLAEESGRRLILFLDAVDQLSDADGARSLVWLPAELPRNVCVVVSTLRADRRDGRPPPKGSECLATLRARLPEQNVVELKPMSRDEGAALLDLWLEDARRTLKRTQRDEVLFKFAADDAEHEDLEDEGLPLYLKLAFEEARRWRSYTDAAELTPRIPGIIRKNLFARLERDENHGETLVSYSLGHLGAARNGLSEGELLDVLSRQVVLHDFQQRSPRSPKVKRLPVVVWSRLYFDLEPYLGERSADGASLMSFYHRQLAQVVAEDYLVEDEERLAKDPKRDLHDGPARHRELAEYFADERRQPLVREEGDKRTPNLRKMSELPYQQTHGEMWEELFGTLTDFEFLERKAADYGVVTDAAGKPITYTGVFSLQEDYALALEKMPGDGGSARGGRRTIIVTGTNFGDGYVIRCPHCNVVHTFDTECETCGETHDLDDWVGRELDCTNAACRGPLKVNTFTVPARV